MALYDDQGWVTNFNTMLHVQHAQQGSLLQNLLDPINIHRDFKGHIDYFDRTAPVVAPDIVNPSAAVIPLNPLRSRRAVTLIDTHAPVHIYDSDKIRSLIDPTNQYTQLMLDALGRRVDAHILNAATGNATTASVTSGTGVLTYGTAALPASRKIGTGVALTLINIINANELLSKAGNPMGPGQRFWCYSPGQERDILNITQATSSDFTRNQLHDRGSINGIDWEGFRWVMMMDVVDYDISMLQRLLTLTGTTRSNVAFHRGAIGVSKGMEIQTHFDPRPDLNGRPLQARPWMSMGAVRIFDGAVVQIDVLEN